jgi:hypothetical protein
MASLTLLKVVCRALGNGQEVDAHGNGATAASTAGGAGAKEGPSMTASMTAALERGITYWADPFHRVAGKINTNDGGRGAYWDDPDGHHLEIITVPYGGAC